MKKVLAIIVLFLLLVVPFLNWRAGAVLWLMAWALFVLQGLFVSRNPEGSFEEKGEEEKKTDRL